MKADFKRHQLINIGINHKDNTENKILTVERVNVVFFYYQNNVDLCSDYVWLDNDTLDGMLTTG